MGGRGAVGAVLAVWAGLLLGAPLGAGGASLVLGLALPCAGLGWRARDRAGTVAALLTLVLAGLARAGAHHAALETARSCLEPDRSHRLEGRVLAPPEHASGEFTALVQVLAAEPALVAGTRVRLRLPPGAAVEWSDRLHVVARLELPGSRRNPGGSEPRAFADAAATAALGRAFVARAAPAQGLEAWPRATVARWRRAIERRFDRWSDETRELVVPLVIGDRSALSPALNGRFRASGLIHLLALSGLHVAWMAAIARGLAASVGLPPAARALAGGLAGLVYLGLAGPIPSLARAAATELLQAVARASARALDPVQALALSALGLLLVAPGWAADLGFQLSCAATLGLVAVGPALSGLPGRWSWARRALAPTLSAQLTALPILLGRFHAISWVAPLANLAAVPVSGLLLAGAWLAIVVDLAAPGAAGVWFGAGEVLARVFRVVTEVSARAPSALLASGDEPAVAFLAAVGAGLVACGWSGPRDLEARRRELGRGRIAARWLGVWASVLALVLAVTARPLLPEPGKHWLVVLDVGQGDALALAFPEGWWLIDAGPRSPRYDAGESVVLPFLRWAGARRLETLAITHGDGDHEGGAAAVLRGIAVGEVLHPPSFPMSRGPGERLGGAAISAGARLRERPPARVLWPPDPGGGPGAHPVRSDNDASLVIVVGEGEARMLLLADVDSTIEAILPVDPGVAVLKVAHHGSGSSSGSAFLARARPRVAAISCGRRNPFGHPSPGTLARLGAAGAKIERTDLEGALWYETCQGGARRVDWRRSGWRSSSGTPPPAAPGSRARAVP